MPEIIGVKFRTVGKVYYFAPNDIAFEVGDGAIVETARGLEYGDVVTANKEVPQSEIVGTLKPVVRKANAKDKEKHLKNEKRKAECMVKAREKTGLPIVSELMSADKIDEFVEHVDLIQVGARNMQNFDLLKAVGHQDKPVMIKRGMSATYEEWLMSAEYVMAGGNAMDAVGDGAVERSAQNARST